MVAKSDAKIRGLILKMLYNKRRESPTKPVVRAYNMIKKLDVEQVVLDYHIFYLAEKGLIIIKTPPNSSWSNAKITATGMDHVDAHT